VRTVTNLHGLLDSEDEGTNIFRNVGSINQSTQRNIPEDLCLLNVCVYCQAGIVEVVCKGKAVPLQAWTGPEGS